MVKKRSNTSELPREFTEILEKDLIEVVSRSVKNAFGRRREVLVMELAKQFRNLSPVASEDNAGIAASNAAWVGIESLSRLRGLVGGRFANLKSRWVEAGFPLREHRGDRVARADINQKGWTELSNWILKQGFEVRQVEDDSEFLFEIRQLGKT
jgi:hypothetical protein